MKFGPPKRCEVSFQVHCVYGGWLRPIQPNVLPPSRRTNATSSPSGMNRNVLSLGCPGTSRWVTGSYFTPSLLDTNLSFHSAGPGGAWPVFAASWAAGVLRMAALYVIPYAL